MILKAAEGMKNRYARKFFVLCSLAALAAACAVAYWWAMLPMPPAGYTAAATGMSSSAHIEGASFSSITQGRLNWHLHAQNVRIFHPANGMQEIVEKASIEKITEGALYQLHPAPGQSRGVPQLTFSADRAAYHVGEGLDLPVGLTNAYLIEWQLGLQGNVHLTTSSHMQITAPQLFLLQMRNRQTGREARRVLCLQGADVSEGKVRMHAAELRFDPSSRELEALNGVQASEARYGGTSLHCQSAFFMPKEGEVRLPGPVFGVLDAHPFTASNVAWNPHKGILTALTASVENTENEGVTQKQSLQPLPGIPAAPAGSTAQKTVVDKILFNGPYRHDDNTSVSVGTLFTFVQGSTTVTGDYARYNQRKGILNAKGHLVYNSLRYHAICNKAYINERTHQRIFSGAVVLQLKPRASTADTKKSDNTQQVQAHGAILHCDRVVYQTDTKIALLTGNFSLSQTYADQDGKTIDRLATAKYARYDANTQIFTLYPPLHYQDSEGNSSESSNPLEVSVKQGDEWEAGVGGTFTLVRHEKSDTGETGQPKQKSSKTVSPAKTGSKGK